MNDRYTYLNAKRYGIWDIESGNISHYLLGPYKCMPDEVDLNLNDPYTCCEKEEKFNVLFGQFGKSSIFA